MRKALWLALLLPSVAFADRFGSLRSGSNVALTTQTVSAGTVYSSASVSYVGISSSAIPCGNSGDVQINFNGVCGGVGGGTTGSASGGIGSLSVNNGILTAVTGSNNNVIYSSNSVSYLGISSASVPADMLTLSSASVSYLGKSSSTLTELTRSSASLSYLGVSSLTVANNVLTLSSASVSYTAISTDALKITFSSSAVSYLGISSTSVDSLTKSSATISYVGISSLTIPNGVISPSSASVSYLGISSGSAPPPDTMTYSSASVSYLGKSTNTFETIRASTFSLEGPYTGSLAVGNSVYMTIVSSNSYMWKTLKKGAEATSGQYRIVVTTIPLNTPNIIDANGAIATTADLFMVHISTDRLDMSVESLNGIGSNSLFNMYRFDPASFSMYYGRILRMWNAGLTGSFGVQPSGSGSTHPTFTWPPAVPTLANQPLTASVAGVMGWGTTVDIGTGTGNNFYPSTNTVNDVTFSSATVFKSTYTTVVSTTMNNYQWGSAPVVFATATGGVAPLTLTGLANSEEGKNFYMFNVSTKPIFVMHQSTFSLQTNRIALSSSTTPIYISSGDCMYFIRDRVNQAWRGMHQ